MGSFAPRGPTPTRPSATAPNGRYNAGMDKGDLKIVRVDPNRGFDVEFSRPSGDWWRRYVREVAGPHCLESLFQKIGRQALLPTVLKALETNVAFVEHGVEMSDLTLDAMGFVRRQE